jgi:hypothetical protein
MVSTQALSSELIWDLSTEQQQVLTGGRYRPEGEYDSEEGDKYGDYRKFPIFLKGVVLVPETK